MLKGKVVIEGTVAQGNRIGRELGFPTANIPVPADCGLRNGVYEVSVSTRSGIYRGMANVGTRPTVTNSPERIMEAHLFGFDGNLYGEKISVEILRFIRDEKRFSSKDELKRQIETDKQLILNNKQ